MRRVFVFSQGVPRLINIICDHALLTGMRQA
jgi:type II secretory pathway predicted ATPase ExeA